MGFSTKVGAPAERSVAYFRVGPSRLKTDILNCWTFPPSQTNQDVAALFQRKHGCKLCWFPCLGCGRSCRSLSSCGKGTVRPCCSGLLDTQISSVRLSSGHVVQITVAHILVLPQRARGPWARCLMPLSSVSPSANLGIIITPNL